MGRHDMDHMQHLETVALSDCAVLQSKEATYQGSWKRSGGASAWFMFRRNMDRLITMMSPKEFPDHITTPQNVKDTVMVLDSVISRGLYDVNDLPGAPAASQAILAMLADRFTSEDIFMKIREKPSGNDGTVLACLRDMRRYAMLVEAEMIAEGVVEPETKTYEQETGVYVMPETDVYQLVADEHGITREQAKERISALFVAPPFPKIELQMPPIEMNYPKATVRIEMLDSNQNYIFPNAENVQVVFGDEIIVRLHKGVFDPDTFASPAQEGFRTTPVTEAEIAAAGTPDVREFNPHDQPVIVDGLVHQAGVLPRKAQPEDYAKAASASGGGQYARERAAAVMAAEKHNPLWPWHATEDEYGALKKRAGSVVDMFYTKRAVGLYQLEAVVGSRTCPTEISSSYLFAGDNRWTIRRDRVPSDLDENFARLRRELNTKEWEGINEDHQFMYAFDGTDLKWKLRADFNTWAREPG